MIYQVRGQIRRHLYSLWLFTCSDLKTIVGPKTAFGILNSLCASAYGLPSKPAAVILSRLPLVFLWTWINLLPFSIDNQRRPKAIEEDRINKPWRPMPSGRVSMAKREFGCLRFTLSPLSLAASGVGSGNACS